MEIKELVVFSYKIYHMFLWYGSTTQSIDPRLGLVEISPFTKNEEKIFITGARSGKRDL